MAIKVGCTNAYNRVLVIWLSTPDTVLAALEGEPEPFHFPITWSSLQPGASKFLCFIFSLCSKPAFTRYSTSNKGATLFLKPLQQLLLLFDQGIYARGLVVQEASDALLNIHAR
ncbi:hypothetical protein XEU83M_11990 [Xanthomonas euvesicatoria]|nr:hypothetical protein XEU83M_11990 [Xanthomonas euvesicatoria]KLB34794.1 hypothetical protein XEUV199_10960 [Xanthomonas euvesicatoria]KLB49421.1 hypothetical protein XEUV329_16950 [Xanthomonas euvesicatoria]